VAGDDGRQIDEAVVMLLTVQSLIMLLTSMGEGSDGGRYPDGELRLPDGQKPTPAAPSRVLALVRGGGISMLRTSGMIRTVADVSRGGIRRKVGRSTRGG
jgi:hypothetical protein